MSVIPLAAPISAPAAPPAAAPARRRIGPGSVLGKYLLQEPIGAGGEGVVFRALHRTLNIPVAVKILRPAERERDRLIYHCLRSEAQLLAQLNHPHIVRAWDFEDDPRLPYLVLEFVDGPSLAALLDSGPLPPFQALMYIRQAAEGLEAATQLGIIHRDVKPGNILIDLQVGAKLADLGQAVVRRGEGQVIEVCGTPAYMAPEQSRQPRHIDFRADMYGLGCTFYHAVTGQTPFDGDEAQQFTKHLRQAPRPPHEVCPSVPPAMSAVILRMMAKKPEDRYASYGALLAALRALPNLEGDSTPRTTRLAPIPRVTRLAPPADSVADTKPYQRFSVEELAAKQNAALQLARHGDRTTACALLRTVVQTQPDHESAWVWLANTSDDPRERIRAWERVLALNPQHEQARAGLSAAQLALAIVEIKGSNKLGARALLAPLTVAEPENESAWLWLAATFSTPQEALPPLLRVLEINPNNVHARKGVTHCRQMLGAKSAERVATPGPVVWVADALAASRQVIMDALRELNYRPIVCFDGPNVLGRLKQGLPAALIVEVNLPGMDGYQICRTIKASKQTSAVPVILISNRAGPFQRARAKDAGALDLLVRPVTSKMLADALANQPAS